jgi:hypothetical protein
MTLVLHEHPFAAYCWKALIALYDRDVPFERRQVDDAADRARLAEALDAATARAERLDGGRREVARRLDQAIEAVRTLLGDVALSGGAGR